MSEVILSFDYVARFCHIEKHFDEIKQLQDPCNNENTKTQISYKRKAIKGRFAIDVRVSFVLTYSVLCMIKALVLASWNILFEI